MTMFRRVFFASLLLFVMIKTSNGCCLFGLSPAYCLPDFCTMLYSAFCGWWAPTSTTPSAHRLRFDKTTGSWTYNCPCTKGCQYGVDPGDPDTCPQCLLGPSDTCDSWNGQCGNGLLCQYSGPTACSGKCVWKDEFYSRGLEEDCGEWDGECAGDLRCKYDQRSALLLPLYGGWVHMAGRCSTEEDFKSQQEGDICSELAGSCANGLECQPATVPWCPMTCVPVAGSDEEKDVHNANDLNQLSYIVEEESEDEAIIDLINAIENSVPDVIGQTDPETGEFEMIVIENLEPSYGEFTDEEATLRNTTSDYVNFELIIQEEGVPQDTEVTDWPVEMDIVMEFENPEDGEPEIFELDGVESFSPEIIDGILQSL